MKMATVRELQHNLAGILALVERGEEVHILRRKKVVARLLPAEPQSVATPDFLSRARAIWGDEPPGASLSKLVDEDRSAP